MGTSINHLLKDDKNKIVINNLCIYYTCPESVNLELRCSTRAYKFIFNSKVATKSPSPTIIDP